MTKTKHKKIIGFTPVPAKALGQAAGHQNLIFLHDVEDGDFRGEVKAKINVNNIGLRYQLENNTSIIQLPHGEKLRIALSMDALDDRLHYSPVGDIDLCDVTGSNFHVRQKPEDHSKDIEVVPEDLKIGDKVYNDAGVCTGIYLGQYSDLKQIFDLYAAPEDLTDENDHSLIAAFNTSVEALNQKKNWHGYDGECFYREKELNNALVNGTYQGGWMLPTNKILRRLYKHKDVGDLKDTFKVNNQPNGANRYWSCTECRGSAVLIEPNLYRPAMSRVRFSDGEMRFVWPDHAFSSRPVRAELRR